MTFTTSVRRAAWGMLGVAAAALPLTAAQAADPIRIGVIYDFTGPFAAGGSQAAAIGTQIAIDMINEKGGVEGHKIEAITADAQSKAEVAINETSRLLDQEKVDLIMGVYSSAHCVPMAQKIDAQKKFMWANVCTASAVFKGKNLSYVFRGQVHTDQFGWASCTFLNENAEKKLGIKPADLKVAIIHEDGPYGAGVAAGNDETCKKNGMTVVLKEGYAATAPDLSSLVTKLRRARPDVILHTGYNPDITLFLRQAKEQGLKWAALIGHGAGYGQIDKLKDTFGKDADYIYNVDPVAAQLLDPKTLAPGLGDLTAEMIKRYKAQTNAAQVPPHTSMGFNQSWVFFTDVLPRAIKTYGGYDPEALRKAALDTDIPVGGTIQGYGVKFNPPGDEMAGQNARSSPVVMQYVNGETKIVWPTAIKTMDPVLPLPSGHSYAR
ncbi:ABC transporter substrate-binding protein [Thalassobaculum sp.]|uniref:ABC transporter substrate-binding protein n=1 Tax=Thalassobaculum sp. TaxID=2022740 RepID=UPI0032EB3413